MFSPFTSMGWAVVGCALLGCSAASPKADLTANDPAPTTGAMNTPSTGGQNNTPDAMPSSTTGGDGGEPVELPPEGLAFPKGFVFGTAIAGFQADMGCPTLSPAICTDTKSDWTVFTTAKETVESDNAYLNGQDPAKVGPGFWELYKDDIKRADEELHNQSLRLSIEWSRVFPEATDELDGFDEMKKAANAGAVAHYHDVLKELKDRGMRPLVTLNHYALPTWIHDAVGCHTDFDNCSPKGWVDSERTLKEIVKFTAFVAKEFGGEIDWWATLNEPLQNMLFGYVQPGENRSHPPAVSLKTAAARIVFNALIDAHARMYDAIKANDLVDADGDSKPSFVGVVYPLVPISPADPNALLGQDKQAAENIDYLWNRAYLNAVALGQYDEKLDRKTVQREDLAGRMDYVGMNYYFGITVSGLGFAVPVISDLSPLFTANPLDFKETENDPTKLEGFLKWINDDLGVPAIITENGAVDPDDDGTGPRFIVRNLKALAEAIQNGRDVRGYYYWTLTDNYEWNHGMDTRMGLYGVDKADAKKQRFARQGVSIYGQIAKFGVVPNTLIDAYGATE